MAKKKETEAQVYDVPALVIAPEKAPAITGNYTAIETVLEKWSAKVLAMTLTEDNLDEVLSIKKAAVAVRNQIDTKVDAAKKALFNDPKRFLKRV
jgi:C4-type Zn-finger protein